jgi:hypothetical protein
MSEKDISCARKTSDFLRKMVSKVHEKSLFSENEIAKACHTWPGKYQKKLFRLVRNIKRRLLRKITKQMLLFNSLNYMITKFRFDWT